MDKVVTWTGMTQSHGFDVEVSRDLAAGEFVAQIQTYSPLSVPQYFGGPIPMMNFDDWQEVRHRQLDPLCGLTKQSIIIRCGKILQFVEYSAQP